MEIDNIFIIITSFLLVLFSIFYFIDFLKICLFNKKLYIILTLIIILIVLITFKYSINLDKFLILIKILKAELKIVYEILF